MCRDVRAQCSSLRYAGRERKTRLSALSAAKVKVVLAFTAAVPAHELDASGSVDCKMPTAPLQLATLPMMALLDASIPAPSTPTSGKKCRRHCG